MFDVPSSSACPDCPMFLLPQPVLIEPCSFLLSLVLRFLLAWHCRNVVKANRAPPFPSYIRTLHCAFQLGPPASMRVCMYVHLYSTYGYWYVCICTYLCTYVCKYICTVYIRGHMYVCRCAGLMWRGEVIVSACCYMRTYIHNMYFTLYTHMYVRMYVSASD